TRLARDEHDLGAAHARGLKREVEARELHPSADERGLDIDRGPWRRALSGERVRQDRPVFPFHLDRTDLAEAELPVCEPEGRLGDIDLAGRRRLLQPRRGVHRVPHDPVLGGARTAPATTMPLWVPIRRPSSIPSWAFTLAACSAKSFCMPMAQRSARWGSSSCAIGAPKITKIASPMNFSIVPSYRRASSARSS